MKQVKYWAPVLLLIWLIFTVSALPVEAPTGDVFWPFMLLKKLIHVGEYGLLFLLAYRAYKGTTPLDKPRVFIWSVLLVLATAIFDEYRQDFIPGGGTSHFSDVMIDLLGAGLAYLFIWKLIPKTPMKLRSLVKLLELD